MIRENLAVASRVESPVQEVDVNAIHAWLIARDPAIEPGSTRWQAAVVLLLATRLGQNVDRLARTAGIPREAVARFARRLVDNGVWRGGDTVCCWLDDAQQEEAFWADAGVAEGKLCRQVAEDGSFEWAPQGYWRKDFEYAHPRATPQPQVISYRPHVEPLPPEPLVFEAEEDEDRSFAEESSPLIFPRHDLVPTAESSRAEDDASEAEAAWESGEGSPSIELFPEAVWLG